MVYVLLNTYDHDYSFNKIKYTLYTCYDKKNSKDISFLTQGMYIISFYPYMSQYHCYVLRQVLTVSTHKECVKLFLY